MRLIRLATDNNANFDANFDVPIPIEANSKMALQNTTFERGFDILEISSGNREIEFKTPEMVKTTRNIPPLSISTQEDQADSFHHISASLNSATLDAAPFDSSADEGVFGGSEFAIRRHPKTREVELSLVLSPLLPPFLTLGGRGSIMDRNEDDYTFVSSIGSNLEVGDRFGLKTGKTRNTDRSFFMDMAEGLSFCRGNGTYSVQIENSVDNSQGSPLTTNNGVGIGFIIGTGKPLNGDLFPLDTDVDFELYFNREGENYTMINGKGTGRVDTGITPLKVNSTAHADITTHDIMGFTIEGGNVIFFVSKDTGAVSLKNNLLTDAQKLAIQKFGINAYIYCNDTIDFIKVANARITASPFVNSGEFQNEDNIASFAASAGRDKSVVLAANHYNNLPFRYNPANTTRLGGNRFVIDKTFNLGIDTSIQRYFGFTPPQFFQFSDNLVLENGKFIIVAGNDMSMTFTDFFMVESQTLQLDSYDARPDERLSVGLPYGQSLNAGLKGDRKSILATIPINESRGDVEFETNTPIFIDIKNTNQTNIRNLKLRIVDGNFNPIITTNTSNLTLLIKGPNE